jgi:hypothetical protein
LGKKFEVLNTVKKEYSADQGQGYKEVKYEGFKSVSDQISESLPSNYCKNYSYSLRHIELSKKRPNCGSLWIPKVPARFSA